MTRLPERRKLRLLIAALVSIGTVAAGAIIWFQATNANANAEVPVPKELVTCSACHNMEKEVQAWQEGPHSEVACLECHVESDVAWVRHELTGRSPDMAEMLGNAKVHPVPLKAPNDRCLDCHGQQMPYILQDVTPPPLENNAASAGEQVKAMQIKALHNEHINGDSKLDCLACHVASAHGATPGTTAQQDEAHSLCLTCHSEKRVTMAVPSSVSCAACHVTPSSVAPADHKDTNGWMAAHGTSSTGNTCGQCHLATSAGPHTDLASPASFQSNTGDACATCHAGVPMPHPANFLTQHGAASEQAAPGTCERCHTPEKNPIQPTPDHAKAGYCTECHAGTAMPHPAGYLNTHGTAAMQNPATCEACHSGKNPINPTADHASQTYCSSCHDQYQHQSGWVVQHGSSVNATCATCHTMVGEQGQHNACATCHDSQNTSTGRWHPDMWFASHARVVLDEGKGDCMKCHAEVEPSCSKCHTSF
jgi:hypothetical protein